MKTSSTRRPLHKQSKEKTASAFFTKNDRDSSFFQAKSIEGNQYSAMEKEADQVAQNVTQSLYSTPSSSSRTGVQKKATEEEKPVQKVEDEKKEDTSTQQKSEDEKQDESTVQQKAEDEQQDESVQMKAEDEQKDESVQMKAEDEKKEDQPVQKKEDKPVSPQTKFEGILRKTKGGGAVLPAKVRGLLEQRMNANFEHVRIHTGQDAVELCNLSKAQAFTNGHDIYFNANKFDPESAQGLNLLAHELTHIIQQNGPMK